MAKKRIDELEAATAAQLTDLNRNYLLIQIPGLDGLQRLPLVDFIEILKKRRQNAGP